MNGGTDCPQRKTIDLFTVGIDFVHSIGALPVNVPLDQLGHIDGAAGAVRVRSGSGDVSISTVWKYPEPLQHRLTGSMTTYLA